MSQFSSDIDIVLNPEKIVVEISDNSQNIAVTADSITIEVNASLSTSASSVFHVGETPNGVINNSNATFTTLNNFVPESVEVIVNGAVQTNGVDYYTTGLNTINLNISPVIGDIIRVNYKQG
jgi:hypothetical protein